MTLTVFTIGHSVQSLTEFMDLMTRFGVRAVADIRSIPNSRHAPQFNRRKFEAALADAGLRYHFLGDMLGGRPTGDVISEDDRRSFFAQLADHPQFSESMDELWEVVAASPTVVMCAEEDPMMCHRRLLVGKALIERGLPPEELVHIRRRGFVETEHEVAAREEAKRARRRAKKQ